MTSNPCNIASPSGDNRYLPQTRLPEIGPEGQQKLRQSSVLIIGCGALGSPAAVYLAAAGVGKIYIADFDTVDISNLHRQPFFKSSDTGKKKVILLAEHISALNPQINVSPIDSLITPRLLEEIVDNFDFVIDAADNPDTTYMIDSICRDHKVAYVTAGISGWKAQIITSVGDSASFASIFPRPDDNEGILPCSIAGVFGPLAAIVAAVQATEAVKFIIGIKPDLTDRLLLIDILDYNFQILPVGDTPH